MRSALFITPAPFSDAATRGEKGIVALCGFFRNVKDSRAFSLKGAVIDQWLSPIVGKRKFLTFFNTLTGDGHFSKTYVNVMLSSVNRLIEHCLETRFSPKKGMYRLKD